MSTDDIGTPGDGEPTVENLAARVRDLETDVYGYTNDGRSAGGEVMVDVKRSIVFLENRHLEDGDRSGVRIEDIYAVTDVLGIDRSLAEQAFEKLRRQGEVYERATDEVRTT